MKSIKEIKSEIKQIETLREIDHKGAEWKRIGKRRKLLTKCIYYLETNPSENYLDKSYEKLKNKIKLISDSYWTWFENTPEAKEMKNPKGAYNTEMKMKDLKFQQRTLEYLLKK